MSKKQEACPSVGPSDQTCIGRVVWHETHCDTTGTTWRDYAAKVPGLTHKQIEARS